MVDTIDLQIQQLKVERRSMQPSTPRIDSRGRDKALQKSMFLPNHQLPGLHVTPVDAQSINSLKRSSMPMLQTGFSPVAATFHYSQNPTVYQQNKSNQNISFGPNYRVETRIHSQLDATNGNETFQDSSANSSFPNEYHRSFVKPIRNGNEAEGSRELGSVQRDYQAIANQVIQLIKGKYLADFCSGLRKQLCDQINALKEQVQGLRSDWQQEKTLLTNQYKQLMLEMSRAIDSKTSFLNPAHSKIRKQLQPHQWEKQLQEVHQRIGAIQLTLDQKYNTLTSEVAKVQIAKLDKDKVKHPKKSGAKPSLPSILLEYRQLFVVAEPVAGHRKQILLREDCYFIDKQGCLLDCQGCYLLDCYNKQIRLEQKHLQLLQEHGILQK